MGKDSKGAGSYMIGGRTFRKVITTNDQGPTGQGESRPLNVITTVIIPDAVPQPEPKDTDLNKMITTHDEPKAEAPLTMIQHPTATAPFPEAVLKHNGGDKYAPFPPQAERDVEDMSKDKPIIMVEVEIKKKPGRPKKAEEKA